MLLLWQGAIPPAKTASWLNHVNPSDHYHIRSPHDLHRATRLIAGRGTGLVLSGGGAKGLAHVGVIDALTRNGVGIDAIGGTSIGGIVAAVFALGWDLHVTARTLIADFSRRRMLDLAVPRTALFTDRAFERTLGRCFGDTAIEDSPVPLFCVSTDLTRRRSVIHRTGRLEKWLRATSAIPGLFPPIVEDNVVYVDGGVLNNMPTDAVRTYGVASVISVDVGFSGQSRTGGRSGSPHILELLWRVGTIGGGTAADRASHDGDVVLRPEVGQVGLFGWNAHETAIRAGQKVALDHLDQIKSAVGRIVMVAVAALWPLCSPLAQPAGCSLEQAAQLPAGKILRCGDDLTIRSAPETRYQLIDQSSVRLDSGALLIEFRATERRPNFQILTPQAIASVRGTKWAVEVNPGQTSTLVIAGIVTVRRVHEARAVDLGQGQGADVSPGTEAIQVKRWPEKRVNALLARFAQ